MGNEVKQIAYVIGFIIGWIIRKLLNMLMYVWLIAAMIPLFVGIFMFDILLRIFKIDKYYLLITDITAWFTMLSEHLKSLNTKKDTTGETTNYV